ncbi:hypothetical protein ACGFNF_17025 [Micromonospora sp. NPDC048868]|uniref:hypothetical protein n=1 Tax=Micromonospora sp. NPDC048868 TaxID=3364258 RepID=UPI00371CC45A
MTIARPDQAATESAVARLLSDSLLMIRFLAAQGQPTSSDEFPGWRQQVHALADLCHNLPALLDPSWRDRVHDGVAYTWKMASPGKRDWIRQCWDAAGYDYRWLLDASVDEQPIEQPSQRTQADKRGSEHTSDKGEHPQQQEPATDS